MSDEISFRDQVLVPVPLPRLARCATCKDEIRVRGDGRMYKHERPFTVDSTFTIHEGRLLLDCPESGSRAEVLEPTFARWLWMQSKRRDEYTNPLTDLAASEFRGCTRSPRLTPADVGWGTSRELHERLHRTQPMRTGSEKRSGGDARCDWKCRDLRQAAEIYERLLIEEPRAKEKS